MLLVFRGVLVLGVRVGIMLGLGDCVGFVGLRVISVWGLGSVLAVWAVII